MNTNIHITNRIQSNICHTCGGDAPGWKCPKCKQTAPFFDPSHWQKCKHGAKLQAQCAACGEAEEQCSCTKIQ